jgi:hypothetical protein
MISYQQSDMPAKSALSRRASEGYKPNTDMRDLSIWPGNGTFFLPIVADKNHRSPNTPAELTALMLWLLMHWSSIFVNE